MLYLQFVLRMEVEYGRRVLMKICSVGMLEQSTGGGE